MSVTRLPARKTRIKTITRATTRWQRRKVGITSSSGADVDRQQINVLLGIATNGFFVFAPFPASDTFASFLLGAPVLFFQGGGDFSRGLRKWVAAGYAQDEWRVTPNLTLSYGLPLRGQYALHGSS